MVIRSSTVFKSSETSALLPRWRLKNASVTWKQSIRDVRDVRDVRDARKQDKIYCRIRWEREWERYTLPKLVSTQLKGALFPTSKYQWRTLFRRCVDTVHAQLVDSGTLKTGTHARDLSGDELTRIMDSMIFYLGEVFSKSFKEIISDSRHLEQFAALGMLLRIKRQPLLLGEYVQFALDYFSCTTNWSSQLNGETAVVKDRSLNWKTHETSLAALRIWMAAKGLEIKFFSEHKREALEVLCLRRKKTMSDVPLHVISSMRDYIEKCADQFEETRVWIFEKVIILCEEPKPDEDVDTAVMGESKEDEDIDGHIHGDIDDDDADTVVLSDCEGEGRDESHLGEERDGFYFDWNKCAWEL